MTGRSHQRQPNSWPNSLMEETDPPKHSTSLLLLLIPMNLFCNRSSFGKIPAHLLLLLLVLYLIWGKWIKVDLLWRVLGEGLMYEWLKVHPWFFSNICIYHYKQQKMSWKIFENKDHIMYILVPIIIFWYLRMKY